MTARQRARLLARGRPLSPALVLPLAVTQAAEIEALPQAQFLSDATKLCKGLQALSDAFGTDVIVTADGRRDLLTQPGQAEAAVEATRRLRTAVAHAAIAAALPGPRSDGDVLPLARAFLEAGANLLLLVEEEPLPAGCGEAWRGAVTTVNNVARFYQAAMIVVLAGGSVDAAFAPRGAVVCVPDPAVGQGLALAGDPRAWTSTVPDAPVITTLGPARGTFSELREAVGRLTA